MNCKEIQMLLSLSLDGALNREEQELIDAHLETCEVCRQEYTALKELKDALTEIPLLPLPADYHAELMEKIKREKILPLAPVSPDRKKAPLWKKYTAIAAALLAVIVVGGGLHTLISPPLSQKEGYTSSADTAAAPMEMKSTEMPAEGSMAKNAMPQETASDEALEAEKGLTESAQQDGRKKIKTLNMSMEVENFDEAISALKNLCNQTGGYTENYNSSIRYADSSGQVSWKEGSITLRMPAVSYDETVTGIKNIGRILDENEYTEDVTFQYMDTAGLLKMRRIEEERLLAFLEKAETVEDIIAIEARLSEIRMDIESYTTALKNWDQLVEFSTIQIYVTESNKEQLHPFALDFSTRAKNSFLGSVNQFTKAIESLILGLIQIWIPLLLLLVLSFFGLLFWKHRKKKKNSNSSTEES